MCVASCLVVSILKKNLLPLYTSSKSIWLWDPWHWRKLLRPPDSPPPPPHCHFHRQTDTHTHSLTHTYTHTQSLTQIRVQQTSQVHNMRKCHHFYLWWWQITGHSIISCAVGTISFSPEAVRQVSVGRFRHASLLTGVGHVSVIRFRHAWLLTSVWQVSAGTCFTAHSSGAGVIHQIQTWFTAHISAACISWHKLHCSQQCCRCQSADWGTLRCWLKTLLQMAPHSSSLFGFELRGCDDLFGGNLEVHLFCSVSRRTPFLLCLLHIQRDLPRTKLYVCGFCTCTMCPNTDSDKFPHRKK